MKYFYIYKTTNLINSKFYIGKHVSNKENDNYLGSGKLLWRSINKHGIENFKKEILEYCENHDILKEREIYWIEKENSLFPNGYNIAKGGEGGDLFTNNPDLDQIKEKFRQNGYNQTSEHREAFTKSRLGDKHTEESKKKISDSRKGIKFSDEHRANIGKACIKYMKIIPRYNQKKINCYTKDGIFIKETDSIAQAAREFNQSGWEICNMCKGRKPKIKDFIFRYSDGTTHNIIPEEKSAKKKIVYKERTCPHCNKVGKGQGMTKYHFDNCKYKK